LHFSSETLVVDAAT